MKCKECKHCKQIGRTESQRYSLGRKEYFCENPEVYKLKDEYGYPINNFVGYGDTTMESPLQLKTSKKWCPLKKVDNQQIKEKELRKMSNCCIDIDTLITLEKRAEKDLEKNTYDLGQEEVLTIIREFIRCKNDCLDKDKKINFMAERINWLCKTNGILLDEEHGMNFDEEDIKQYVERKINNESND